MSKNILNVKFSEKELCSIINNNIPGVISIYNVHPNKNAELIYLGPGLEKIIGEINANKISSNPHTYYEYIHKDDKKELKQACLKAYSSNTQLDHTYRLKTDEDKYAWIRTRFNIRKLDSGIFRWEGIIFDVTKQKENEQKLRTSKEHLNDLIENANDIIWEADTRGKYRYLNNMFNKILNFETSELINQYSGKLIHEEDRPKSVAMFRRSLKGERVSYEIRCLTKEKKIKHFWIKLRPLYKKFKVCAINGVSRDITERIKAEQIRALSFRITEKVNETNDLFEFAKVVQKELSEIMSTKNFFLAIYNKELDRYTFPYHCDEKDTLLRHNLYSLKNTLTDYVRSHALPLLFSKKNEKELNKKQVIQLMGNNSIIWIGAPIMDEKHKEAIGVIALQSYDNENEYTQKDLETLEFVALNIDSLIIKKMWEIRQRSTNKQLSLITKILRHDLTNDLVVIKTALKLYNSSKDEEFIKEAKIKADNGLELINQMREQEDFAAENKTLAPYKLNKIMAKMQSEFPSIEFTIKGEASIFADQSIYSIFSNIIGNAIKHGQATKINLDIEIEARKCIIRIKNNGSKIIVENDDEIFKEGYSTSSSNSGMGLYLVKKSLENYHGAIFLETNQESNVSFVLIFQKSIYR